MIEKVSYEIANTTGVTSELRKEVLSEFQEMSLAQDYITEGGLDYAKILLTKALGPQYAKEIISAVSEFTQQN